MINIGKIDNLTKKDYQDCLKLLPQLLAEAVLPTYDQFQDIVKSPTTYFYIAKDSDSEQIVGMVTLILYYIPMGICARIEDLVVDKDHRQKGIGKTLCQAAIDAAEIAKATKLDLTSNPSRKEAHRLYESLGFMIYDTNVYRLKLH